MDLIVLGSGMAGLPQKVGGKLIGNLQDLLTFPLKELAGHSRDLHEFEFNQKHTITVSGRLHAYEGYSIEELDEWIGALWKAFNPDKVILTATSGSLNPSISPGIWVKVDCVCSIWRPAVKVTPSSGRGLKKATTYFFHTGPILGTKAEYTLYRNVGADLVGMSLMHEINGWCYRNIRPVVWSLPVCAYYENEIWIEPSFEEVKATAEQGVEAFLEILSKT